MGVIVGVAMGTVFLADFAWVRCWVGVVQDGKSWVWWWVGVPYSIRGSAYYLLNWPKSLMPMALGGDEA